MRFCHLALACALFVPAVAQARRPPVLVDEAAQQIVRGDFAAAEPLLQRAVRETPNNPWAHYNLAVVYRNTGRYEHAIMQYEQAKDLFEQQRAGENTIAASLYGIALATEARGQPRAAVDAWQSYIAFARRYDAEQPAIAIARARVDTNLQAAANLEATRKTATRPSITR
jgi:tetratricopeptide (TPR) repeat protein